MNTKICTKCKEEKPFTEFVKGHDRYGLQHWCNGCRKKYYEDNKEQIIKKIKKHYEENREQIAKQRKKHYEENKEQILKKNKKYYQNNRDIIIKNNQNNQKEYYKNNKSKILKRHKKYYQNNPNKFANYSISRRQRKKNAYGNGITKQEWLEIMNSTNWTCFYCGEYIGGKNNKNRTLDHIIPICKGGPHIKENLIPACKSCNSSKHNKMPFEWEVFNNLPKDKQNYILNITNKYSDLIR